LTKKCSNPTFATKLDNRRLKLEILATESRIQGDFRITLSNFVKSIFERLA